MVDRIRDGAPTTERPAGLRSFIHRPVDEPLALPVEGELASFAEATGWLNSDPLTPEGLRGRVVAVDFWTYTASTGCARRHIDGPGTRSTAIWA
jgi:hypothetical protein